MIPPLTANELRKLPDTQLLLRLKTFGRQRQELSAAIEAQAFGGRPDSRLRILEHLDEVMAELKATQDEAGRRLDARAVRPDRALKGDGR